MTIDVTQGQETGMAAPHLPTTLPNGPAPVKGRSWAPRRCRFPRCIEPVASTDLGDSFFMCATCEAAVQRLRGAAQ